MNKSKNKSKTPSTEDIKNLLNTVPSEEISLTARNIIDSLLRIIQDLKEENQNLKDEIAKLKGQKPRPNIRASTLEKPKRNRDQIPQRQNKNGQTKGRKERKREVREIEPVDLPQGSRFKGYRDYTVQELEVQAKEILFRLKVYQTPDGETVAGKIPKEYSYGHFGPELIAYCLQLYHGGGMTEPALLEHLNEHGIDISSGMLNAILIENKEVFHKERENVRQAGLENSPYLNVDDTGARHKGKNGVCTCVSSPLFCDFTSSDSKSRLNFLEILRGKHHDYWLDEMALMYAFEHGISKSTLACLDDYLTIHGERHLPNERSWQNLLKELKICGKKNIRVLTEGAVLSSAVRHGLPDGLPIVSDAAKQFMIWVSHALCWVHEERHYHNMVPISDQEKEELEKIRSEIWDLYEDLKDYASKPSQKRRKELETKFDSLFNRSGISERLDQLLALTYSRKSGLLQVLNHPHIPLHNNDCERDIREYVKRRKISSTTRSTAGRLSRDTFLSLKKTCQKLGVSFFGLLKDRLLGLGQIKPLSSILVQQARAGP